MTPRRGQRTEEISGYDHRSDVPWVAGRLGSAITYLPARLNKNDRSEPGYVSVACKDALDNGVEGGGYTETNSNVSMARSWSTEVTLFLARVRIIMIQDGNFHKQLVTGNLRPRSLKVRTPRCWAGPLCMIFDVGQGSQGRRRRNSLIYVTNDRFRQLLGPTTEERL
jgi:hypothetical protein